MPFLRRDYPKFTCFCNSLWPGLMYSWSQLSKSRACFFHNNAFQHTSSPSPCFFRVAVEADLEPQSQYSMENFTSADKLSYTNDYQSFPLLSAERNETRGDGRVQHGWLWSEFCLWPLLVLDTAMCRNTLISIYLIWKRSEQNLPRQLIVKKLSQSAWTRVDVQKVRIAYIPIFLKQSKSDYIKS